MSVDYVINKQCELQLKTGEHAGETITATPGTGLPAEEVEAWGERAVRHLIDSGFMSRVSANVDVKELVREPSMGVQPVRDGVSDLSVPFGPHGERLDTMAATEEEEEAGEEPEPADGGDEDAATASAESFPQPLGGNKFQLSDGTVVSGRAKAVKAQAALEG